MTTVSDVTNVTYSGDLRADALLYSASDWNYLLPTRTTLYYTFDLSVISESSPEVLTAFNLTQQGAAESILSYVTSVTGISFTKVSDAAQSDFHFAQCNLNDNTTTAGLCRTSEGWSYTTDDVLTNYTAEAFVYLDNLEFAASNGSPVAGNSGYEVLLHEIGHALGLGHPFDGAFRLSEADDTTHNTVMSYTQVGAVKSTFQEYDLLALRWLYGEDGLGGAFGLNSVNGPSLTLNQPPMVSFLVANASVTEGDTGSQTMIFSVELSAPSAGAVTVNYATSNATATAGIDYLATQGVLTFAAGETSKTIAVQVMGDRFLEPNETFMLNLSSPVGASLGALPNATGTILGNDLAGTASYAENLAAYDILVAATSPSVPVVVADLAIIGPDGNDTLTSIERLHFADINLAFDIDTNAGQVYRLYQAAFNRTPDVAGLGGWIAAMDNGTPLLQIASSFMESAEFQSLYGANPSNEAFVANLYTNALHRPAPQDPDGVSYWLNQLASNLQTRAQALVNFSESAENKASVSTVIANGITYATPEQAAGLARGQTFTGTADNDSFIGTVGNDSFTGGAGNDSIAGGRGLDTAIFSDNRSSYTVTQTSTGFTVADNRAFAAVVGGPTGDGTDTLSHVERLQFADDVLAFDIDGNAGQTYRLYKAAFNRTPDKAGLSDWVHGMDNGLTLMQVAAGFIASTEFQNQYGVNLGNADFIALLYNNVLNRPADQGGTEYWSSQLASGATKEQVLIGFSESAENQAALIGTIQEGIAINFI